MASRDIQFNIIANAQKAIAAVGRFGTKMKSTVDENARDASRIGDVFKGVFGGVLGAGIVSGIAGQLSGVVGEAGAASDATDKFKQSLNFAGLKPGKIAELSKVTRAYADKTVYSLTDIQNITAQLATNGVKDYDKLAMASGNLNAVAGGNAETFKSVGMVLTQTAGQGKLTTENWNQLADAIPGASGMIQEALRKNGAFTGNFRDAMSQGQITAGEFNKAILQLGNKPVAQQAATSTSTFEGSLGSLRASVVGVVSDVMTKLKPAFTGIVTVLSGVVSWIGQNISWLGPLAMGIGAVAVAVGIWTAVQWALNAAMTANPLGIIIVGIGLLIGAIILLVTHWGDVVTFLKGVWGGFVGWIRGVINGLATWWSGVWTGITGFFKGVWSGLVRFGRVVFFLYIGWLINLIKFLAQNWSAIWTAIGSFVRNLWQNGIVAPVKRFFTILRLGIQVIGGAIKTWWNGLWSGIAKWVTDKWSGLVSGVKQYFTILKLGLQVIGGAIKTWWNGLWSGIGNFVRDVWNNRIKAPIRTAMQWVKDRIRDGLNGIKTVWGNIWGGLTGTVKGVFNGVLGAVQGGVNGAIDIINGMTSGIRGALGAVGINIGVIPHVAFPRLATGGLTSGPMVAMIGDNPGGRELVTPLDKAQASLERVALAAVRQQHGQGGAQAAPVRLSRADLDYLMSGLSERLYRAIMAGAEKTVDAAFGG